MEEKSLKNFALEYLSHGYSVIAIGRDKRPLLSSWTEFQKRLATPDEVTQWWVQFPHANIGIVTGGISGITVVDIEKGGKTEDLPPTMMTRTGGGGWHFYYKYQKGVRNKVRIRELTDIRGDGGYVIAPPSIHGSGNAYEWIVPEGMADFPVQLFPPQEEQIRQPLKYSEHVGIGKGSRNDQLYRLSCSLLGAVPEYEAWETIQQFNLTSRPPLAMGELLTLFESARKFIGEQTDKRHYTYKRRGVSSVAGDGVQPEEEGIVDPYKPIDICDLSSDQKEIEWVWEGFLAKNHVTLFSALWKVGKSTFISHLLQKLETGGVFPNVPEGAKEKEFPTKQSKVLILSEESDNIWAERRDELGIEQRDWLYVVCRPLLQRLNYKGWVELLEKMGRFAKETGIELFIIDTISGFWSVDNENDAAQVTGALTALNNVLGKNTAIMVVHHMRKSGGDEATSARGSGVLGSYVDIIMEFTRPRGDTNTSERNLKMYSRFRETPSEMVIELGNDEYWLKSTKINEFIKTKKLEILIELLQKAEHGLTAPEIFDKWPEQTIGKSSKKKTTLRTIQRYIVSLSLDNRIKIIGDKNSGKKKTPIWGVSDVVTKPDLSDDFNSIIDNI